MAIRLTGFVAGEPLERELPVGIAQIGRGSTNLVVLVDHSVSRDHAEIAVERAAGILTVRVRDRGSRNGTFVNDARIHEATELADGDHVRFGQVELVLRAPELRAAAPPSGLHLSDEGRVQTTRSFRWDELDRGAGARDLARTLVDALAETGNLLLVPRPEAELHDALLALVERVVPARRIALLLCERGEAAEGGLPTLRAVRPRGLAGDALLVSRTLLRTVLTERSTLLVTNPQDDERFRNQASIVGSDLRSALVAPLFDNERVVGVLYADSSDPRVLFDAEWMRAFSLLANLIAVKLTNARLLEGLREQERMRHELETAGAIQRQMLPQELPEVPGYTLAGRLTPCFEAGGDLYDAAILPDGSLALALGDVTGKGMSAALLMSHTLAGMRLLQEEAPAVEEMALRLYRQVARSAPAGNFVTLFLGRLDISTHRLEFANCGHNPPLVFSASGECRELPSTGLALGMLPLELLPPDLLRSDCATLAPGELLCIFSDGIPEAVREREFFGDERLIDGVRRRLALPVEEIADGLLDDVRVFLGETPPSDDTTLLLVRREALPDSERRPTPAD